MIQLLPRPHSAQALLLFSPALWLSQLGSVSSLGPLFTRDVHRMISEKLPLLGVDQRVLLCANWDLRHSGARHSLFVLLMLTLCQILLSTIVLTTAYGTGPVTTPFYR